MINSFKSGLGRTLGRIFAYILIGFIIYFIASTLKVDAATIDINTYHIEGLNKSGQIVDNAFISNTLTVNSSTQVVGYEWYPMDSNWNYISIEKSQYSIESYFYITYNQNNFMDNALSNHNYLPSSYKMAVGNNLTATCDGTQSLDMYDRVINNNTHIVTLNYRYTCSLLKVTQNFNKFAFNIYFDYFNFNSSQYFKTFVINRQLITDLNGISNDTNVIINNNNQNTQNIITNNNQNTQEIINNNNQNTQEVVSSVEDLNATMTSEDEPSLAFFTTILNMDSFPSVVTDIIVLPLNILRSEINAIGGTCSPWSINTGSLLGNNTWTFPCINISNYFQGYSYQGINLWNLIDYMICFFLGYEIIMLMMSAYNAIMNLDDTFNSLYTPRHAKGGYIPRHAKE